MAHNCRGETKTILHTRNQHNHVSLIHFLTYQTSQSVKTKFDIHFCTNFPIMHFPLTSDPKYNFLLYLRVVSNAIERLVILIRMIIENLNYFRLILLFPFVGFEVSQSGNIHQYFHPFRRLIFYYCTRTFRGVILHVNKSKPQKSWRNFFHNPDKSTIILY